MKTVLLTGSSGFIGGHIIKEFYKKFSRTEYDLILFTSKPIEGYKCILHKNFRIEKNAFRLAQIERIDIVIHAGAFTPKNSGEANLIQQSNSNIYTLDNLILSIPNLPEKFIFLSTLDIYDSNSQEEINENSHESPGTLYGWSKLYCEKIVEKWAIQNNVIIQILRVGHIYGSGEEAYNKIIPLTIKKVLAGESPIIHSKGEELRSYLHVTDCAKLILNSLQLNSYVGPINIVSKEALSIKFIVKKIVSIINPLISIIIEGRNISPKDFVFDNNKMKQYLGEQSIPFITGLEEEIKNFKVG